LTSLPEFSPHVHIFTDFNVPRRDSVPPLVRYECWLCAHPYSCGRCYSGSNSTSQLLAARHSKDISSLSVLPCPVRRPYFTIRFGLVLVPSTRFEPMPVIFIFHLISLDDEKTASVSFGRNLWDYIPTAVPAEELVLGLYLRCPGVL
jgi:hypothetical protein